MKIEDLKKRYAKIRSERETIQGIWDEITTYIMPHRGRMFEKTNSENSVEWDNYDLFDSTAPDAAQKLSASIQGSMISSSTQWFFLNYQKAELNKAKDSSSWLESAESVCSEKIKESNFNQESSEMLDEVCGYNTGVLTHEYDTVLDEMIFKAIPIKESFYELDHKDKVIFFTRIMEWNLSKIIDKFGKDNLPESLKNKADNPSMQSERVTIAYAVWRREDKKNADISLPLVDDERPYGYCYYVEGTGEKIGEEKGYYECPVYVVRWEKTTDSQYGHGPSTIALPDIKMLNQLVYMGMMAIEKAIDPATYGTELGVIGDLDLGAGGHTIVRDMDAFRVMETGARFDVLKMEKVELQTSIRQVFRIDELELKDSPQMTATEARIRYELMQRLLGPTFGRLKEDFLEPVVENTFSMLLRNGKFDEMPESVTGADTKIEYVGPLARAQKSDQAAGIVEYVNSLLATYQVFPGSNILDNVDWDEYARSLAIMRDVPTKLLKGEDVVKVDRKQRAELQAQQLQLEMAQAQGNANKAQAEGEAAAQEVAE